MTDGQAWAIKCVSGLDVHKLNLSFEEADVFIRNFNNNVEWDNLISMLQQMGATGTPKSYRPYASKFKQNSFTFAS